MEFQWMQKQECEKLTLRMHSYIFGSLCKESFLQYPTFSESFIVTTDASQYAIDGMLNQRIIGKELPISYTCRLLNNAEQNYSTIEKELLAIVYSVNYFRRYLYGRKL